MVLGRLQQLGLLPYTYCDDLEIPLQVEPGQGPSSGMNPNPIPTRLRLRVLRVTFV
jgi:hypothetical protein